MVTRHDSTQRELDYKWALTNWLDTPGYDRLVFCENSGANLDSIHRFCEKANSLNKQLDFVRCNSNHGATIRGKGYGEMEIIRQALESLSDLSPQQQIVKVTGRYRARNGSKLLRQLAFEGADICCALRAKLTYADSRLFSMTASFAREHLLPRQDEINDLEGHYLEHVLAKAVHSSLLVGGRWSNLPCDPLLQGISGTSGSNIGQSFLGSIKASVRNQLVSRLM